MQIPDTAFLADRRAVAPVVGFVLLFGIAILAFSGYQATQVPQQNAETEFQHYQDVQNDLIVVRNAISRAGQQGQSQFESVRLGTQYRERIFALNPPDPAGTLRTEGPYEITLANDTTTRTVETRFLEYQNGYNELDIEPIYYENSVLYLDTEDGERVFFEDQNLVRENGNTVVITALQREFSRSTTGRVTVELYPTDAGDPLPTGEVDVTLPTRLPERYWSDQIADADSISNFGYNDRPDDVNQTEFTVNSSELEFNTVGIDDEPDQTGAVSDFSGIDDGDEEGDTSDDIPSFNSLSVNKKGGSGKYEVNYNISDQDGLSSIEFSLFDENGDQVDTVTNSSVSGTTAIGTSAEIRRPTGGGPNTSADDFIRVTVTDVEGNEASQDIDV